MGQSYLLPHQTVFAGVPHPLENNAAVIPGFQVLENLAPPAVEPRPNSRGSARTPREQSRVRHDAYRRMQHELDLALVEKLKSHYPDGPVPRAAIAEMREKARDATVVARWGNGADLGWIQRLAWDFYGRYFRFIAVADGDDKLPPMYPDYEWGRLGRTRILVFMDERTGEDIGSVTLTLDRPRQTRLQRGWANALDLWSPAFPFEHDYARSAFTNRRYRSQASSQPRLAAIWRMHIKPLYLGYTKITMQCYAILLTVAEQLQLGGAFFDCHALQTAVYEKFGFETLQIKPEVSMMRALTADPAGVIPPTSLFWAPIEALRDTLTNGHARPRVSA